MIIYAIVCCPQVQGTSIFICILNCICIYINCILFCIFSYFIGDRVKFNKYAFIVALYMFICLLKFKNIQYMLKYNVFLFVFFHTILTVAQNTWMAHLSIISECYSVYLVIFPICTSLGDALSTPGMFIFKVCMQLRYSYEIFSFVLKYTV